MGSKEGAKKATAILLARDPNYYRKLGAVGGKSVKPEHRPFAMDPRLASRAGKIGGKLSKRVKKK